MNHVSRLPTAVFLCLIPLMCPAVSALGAPDLRELTESPPTPAASGQASAAERFDRLNTLVRDGGIKKNDARGELKHRLSELRDEYYRRGGSDYGRDAWVFPLEGYGAGALGAGGNKGYVASGYDYFMGNRHGGHPSFDIFIHDRNQDCRDDRTGKPVRVLSMTGGIVVSLEREWRHDSPLRGGKYIWIYDPAHELLIYYAHNSELSVRLGDMVKPGDPLAAVGRSGLNAAKHRSPTHLHLTVLRIGEKGPVPVNYWRELARVGTN